MKQAFIICLLSITLTNLKAQGKLLLKSGFEDDVFIENSPQESRIKGMDRQTGFSWDDHSLPGVMKFFYLSGNSAKDYVSTKIMPVQGPTGKTTNALYMEVKNDLPSDRFGMVSRNEFSFFADSSFAEGYISYQIKLQANLLDIAPKTLASKQLDYYQLDSWRMLMEIKEPNSGVSIKGRGTNNYRISFFIARDSTNNKMYWLLRGEMPQPIRMVDWQVENHTVEVPIGEWFRMEAYFIKDSKQGRVWWAVNNKTIVDYHGRTEHPDNPMPVKFWSFFKLYQDEKWFEKGPVYQWIDNVEYWSSYPADHPVLGKID